MYRGTITVFAVLFVQSIFCADPKVKFQFEWSDDPNEPYCEYSRGKVDGWGTVFIQLPDSKGWRHACTDRFAKAFQDYCTARGTTILFFQGERDPQTNVCEMIIWTKDHRCVPGALQCLAEGATAPTECKGM